MCVTNNIYNSLFESMRIYGQLFSNSVIRISRLFAPPCCTKFFTTGSDLNPLTLI